MPESVETMMTRPDVVSGVFPSIRYIDLGPAPWLDARARTKRLNEENSVKLAALYRNYFQERDKPRLLDRTWRNHTVEIHVPAWVAALVSLCGFDRTPIVTRGRDFGFFGPFVNDRGGD